MSRIKWITPVVVGGILADVTSQRQVVGARTSFVHGMGLTLGAHASFVLANELTYGVTEARS